jgi:sphingosine kinase
LSDIRGIFVVSGDGLVYEVINGLMNRDDWREAIKTPIGQLPGGSGNALSASICYLAKETFASLNIESFAMHMGFLTSKYDVLPMDLVAVDISPPKNLRDTIVSNRVYSFLGIEWAIVADVDYESEKYRYLGGFRFTVGALKRICYLRTYHGSLSFLPSSGSFTPKTTNLNIIRNPQSDLKNYTLDNTNTSQPKTKYLTALNKPVPDDWVIIEDRFVLVLIVQKPLIAKDFVAWKDSKLENNEMLLIFVKAGISKIQLIKIFLDSESGDYLNHDLVESVRIKAFRIEPHEESSYMMVDGENVPYGPIQGEILDPMLNCIAKRIESQ